ncbi:alpha/beta hydrolase fold domain-containing protein [Nocardioides rubriscoriae]|uniref:alpha/beta hydrolase fold domain-containing protein n=1 Tax=Nocardioides rubriscoriae TaxID=642762 RepID=UPI0011E02FCB|nr:alpha/beta hydrolase fold domain-containing protein [Nocardioides rubriscoriae]
MRVPLPVMRSLTRAAVRPVLGTRLRPPTQRRVLDALTRLAVLPKGTTVEDALLGGGPALTIRTPLSDPDRALLYLHGGGYTVGSMVTHRAVAAHLAHHAGAVAHLLDYRLAPEHPYPAAVDDALAAYEALLARGAAPGHVVVAGDSAGGGLALALAVRLRSLGRPLPAALALISPWVDLTLDGLDETADDPLLTRAWLERCARDYAGGDRRDPGVSPLLADPADLAGLPPLLVHGARDEILRDDTERFVAAAQAAGVPVRYRCLEQHWHVTHLYAGLVRESTDVVEQLGGWVRAAYVS